MTKKIILTSIAFSLLFSVASAESVSFQSIKQVQCGESVVEFTLKIVPDSMLMTLTVNDAFIGNFTAGAGEHIKTFTKTLPTGHYTAKAAYPSGLTAVKEFNVESCDGGGGGLAPCQIEKTCPFYGETIFDTEKRMMKDPKYVIQKQLVSLLTQLVELYKELLRK